MVAKGVFDDTVVLKELNFVAIRRREFIAYTTSVWKTAAESQKAAGKTGIHDGGNATAERHRGELQKAPAGRTNKDDLDTCQSAVHRQD